MRSGSEVQLSRPARALMVAGFAPVAMAALAIAPVTFGGTLPFAAAFLWPCWWCSSRGADPPARPWRFFLVSGFTIPLAVWAAVLLQGALFE